MAFSKQTKGNGKTRFKDFRRRKGIRQPTCGTSGQKILGKGELLPDVWTGFGVN